MNIPDSIRIMSRDAHTLVFSADADATGEALPTSSIVLYFELPDGPNVQVTFDRPSGKHFVTTTYDAAHVTLDIQHTP